jgi:hypothetical protein
MGLRLQVHAFPAAAFVHEVQAPDLTHLSLFQWNRWKPDGPGFVVKSRASIKGGSMNLKKLLVIGLAIVLQAMVVSAQNNQETEICLPQFVHGTFEDDFRWESSIFFFNLGDQELTPEFTFRTGEGEVWEGGLTTRLGRGDEFQIGEGGVFSPEQPFAGRAGGTFRTVGEEQFRTGFVTVRAPGQFGVMTRAHLFDAQGNLIAETSIIPQPAFRTGAFVIDTFEGQRTGLALANTHEAEATCTLTFFREGEADAVGEVQLDVLGGGMQTARMLDEMFPELFADDAGFVLIDCDQPVCALAMNLRGLDTRQIPIFVLNNAN